MDFFKETDYCPWNNRRFMQESRGERKGTVRIKGDRVWWWERGKSLGGYGAPRGCREKSEQLSTAKGKCAQGEKRSFGVLDSPQRYQWDTRCGCTSPWHTCLLGCPGHTEKGQEKRIQCIPLCWEQILQPGLSGDETWAGEAMWCMNVKGCLLVARFY